MSEGLSQMACAGDLLAALQKAREELIRYHTRLMEEGACVEAGHVSTVAYTVDKAIAKALSPSAQDTSERETVDE